MPNLQYPTLTIIDESEVEQTIIYAMLDHTIVARIPESAHQSTIAT